MPFSNFPYNALRRQIASICAERNWETRFQGCSVYLRGSILEEMDINSSKIEVLPDSFSALINLRKLSIGWSSLKELPTQFYDLYFPYSVTRNNITWTLDVATNARSDLEQEINRLRLNHLCKEVAHDQNLQAMTRLDLNYKELIELPEAIDGFCNLEELWLQRARFTTLPDSLINMTKLHKINLREVKIEEIPACLKSVYGKFHTENGKIVWDHELDIIDELIPSLNQRRLEALCDAGPNFEGGALHCLDLSNQGLTSIPENIHNLSDIVELNLRGNPLTELPETMSQLLNLRKLDVRETKLETLPSWLPTLSVDSKKLDWLLDNATKLSNLCHLQLAFCRLQEIPSEIMQLSQLKSLDISCNNIKKIGPELAQLTDLNWLSLRWNALEEIAAELAHLKNLQTVLISPRQQHLQGRIESLCPQVTVIVE